MIIGRRGIYCVNPAIRTSPQVQGQYRLYFSDRTTSFKLNAEEWEFIKNTERVDTTTGALYSNCKSLFEDKRAKFEENEYIDWLLKEGILVKTDETDSRPGLENDQVSKRSLSTNKVKDDKKILLFNLERFTARGLLRPPKRIISLQYRLFPIAIILFAVAIYNYYFGLKPMSAILAGGSEPITVFFRLTVMLMMINMISVVSTMLTTYALHIDDQKLYLRLRWGFIPRFAKEKAGKGLREKLTEQEYLVLTAQPILTRIYIVTLAIAYLYVFTPGPDASPYSNINVVTSIIQGGLVSLIILLLPIRSTPGMKLLEHYGIAPKNYLVISGKRFINIASLTIKGKFKEISLTKTEIRSILFIVILLTVLSIKVYLLYNILIPKIAYETPTIFGHWTSWIVRLALTVLLVRFLYLNFASKIIEKSSGNKRVDRTKTAERNRENDASEYRDKNQYKQGEAENLHLNVKEALSDKRVLIVVLIIVFLFPFQATITGTASVTEGESLEIRAVDSARIRQIFEKGPSTKILKEGTKVLMMSSPTLSSELNQQLEENAALESEIRTQKTLIKAIESGSIKLEALNRNEELKRAEANAQKIRSQIKALSSKLAIQNDQLKKLRVLATTGAVSEFQYQNLWAEQQETLGLLESAKSELTSATAEVSIATRNQTIDQNLNYDEQLSKANDELISAESKLKVGQISLEVLKSQIEDLTIRMPFDGVISSSTKTLLNSALGPGDTIMTVKAQPLTKTNAYIPEYDRARIEVGFPCVIRLYSAPGKQFDGKVSSINPATVEINGLDYMALQIDLEESLPTNFIGSTGYAKIEVGYTCLLFNIIAPISRFVNVDLWSLLP